MQEFRAAQACRPLPRCSALRRHVTRAIIGSTSVKCGADPQDPLDRIVRDGRCRDDGALDPAY